MTISWYEIPDTLHTWSEETPSKFSQPTLLPEVWDWVEAINADETQVEIQVGVFGFRDIRFITEAAHAEFVLRFGRPG